MTTTTDRLAQLQQLVREAGLDGWLLYDFRGQNPFPQQVLDLGAGLLTRRWFLYVPANGRPTLLQHRIEATTWQRLLPDDVVDRKSFSAHEEMDALLFETLAGAQRIAMEYSPRGDVPYVSCVDAGTVERVRECGVDVVSSADLLQHFQVWTEADRLAHLQAVDGVVKAKDAGFQLIRDRLSAHQPITELEVQALLVEQITHAGLEFDHAPIVAFGSHASDGHYAPSAQN